MSAHRLLILDTSVFVNPAAAQVFGPTPTLAFREFLEMAQRRADVQFLMPPSIYAELMHFAEESKIPRDLLVLVNKQPPKKHELKVPGFFIYTLVEAMRDRIDRGLRLSERHVREALAMPAPIAGAKENVRPDAEAVGRLRESYRRIMREGMLDSKADVDLLLLAYETGGTLVSADEGVLAWAENLGVSLLSHDHLYEFLTLPRL
jgi:uncharacterized protein